MPGFHAFGAGRTSSVKARRIAWTQVILASIASLPFVPFSVPAAPIKATEAQEGSAIEWHQTGTQPASR
jgi:hypothetical protein